MYTKRHTQWYYFRVQNMVPGIIYKFRIVNLLKKDSLYNYGESPSISSFTPNLIIFHVLANDVSNIRVFLHILEGIIFSFLHIN